MLLSSGDIVVEGPPEGGPYGKVGLKVDTTV